MINDTSSNREKVISKVYQKTAKSKSLKRVQQTSLIGSKPHSNQRIMHRLINEPAANSRKEVPWQSSRNNTEESKMTERACLKSRAGGTRG